MIPTGKRNAATLQIRPKGHQLPHSLYRHCGYTSFLLSICYFIIKTHTQIYMVFFCLNISLCLVFNESSDVALHSFRINSRKQHMGWKRDREQKKGFCWIDLCEFLRPKFFFCSARSERELDWKYKGGFLFCLSLCLRHASIYFKIISSKLIMG